MTPKILTLLIFTLIQQECYCWVENLNQLPNISPVSIPPMEDRVFLFTTTSSTETPVKFRYEPVPNEPLQDLKLIDKPMNNLETIPEKTLMKTLKIDLKKMKSNLNEDKNETQLDRLEENSLSTTEKMTIEPPKPIKEPPPYEADDTRKVTIQLKPNKWAFGSDKGKELYWKQLLSSTEQPKGFYFKAMQGKLMENNGPAEVIQEINVTNGVNVTQKGINAYVRKDYDPVPKPNTHIYIKVVRDGTGNIDPVTIHEPEIVYQNGSKKDTNIFPATALRQNERNYSIETFQNHHANSDKVKEGTPSRNELDETERNRLKVSQQNDQIIKYNSYHIRNDSLYAKTNGKQLPQRVEIEPIPAPPPQNVTNKIKYSHQIPVDYSIQENPYINPIKHVVENQYVLNQPRYHVTTPSYYSNPDYNEYHPDYNSNPHSFKPVTPIVTTSTTTQLPTEINTITREISPPIIPTIPSTGQFIYFKNNPGVREKMKVQIIHHSDYEQNKTLKYPDQNQDQIEMQGVPTPPTITVSDDPNAKHVYFNIHHEQHIKHDNGKTTLNTNPVYQVNIIPQYPSAPVHVSLKNNERVTVISSPDNKDTNRSVNISIVSRNGTLDNDLDDVDVGKTPITEIKKLVQLSEAGETETETKSDTEEKTEDKTPTSVNDILRAIARSGQARNAKRLENLTTKNDQVKPSTTTSKPARKFTFQTVETTPLVNLTTPTTWNNMFEKFQYLARKTLNDEKHRANNSEVLSSLKMLTPDPQSVNRVAYLPNKYSSVSPLPMVETNLETSNDPKITTMPTHAKAYIELKIKDSSKRHAEEDMKTFPPGVPRRDWSERTQGQHNKRDLNAKTEKVEVQIESVDKIPKNDDMFKNMKYETIVENGQMDNMNSHSFPFKHVTGSNDSPPSDNQQRFSKRKVNGQTRQPYNNYQQQSERNIHENIDTTRNPGKQSLQLPGRQLPEGRLPDERLPEGELPTDGQLPDGQLPTGGQIPDGQDPQLSFQQEEFDYGGKRYKIKNGYAYEINGPQDDTNYDGGIPQEGPENGARLVYEDPNQTDRKKPSNYITENPSDLQLELNPTDNGKKVPSKPDQVTQPPEYMDVFEPLPKQKNILDLTIKQNKPRKNFHRAPVKSYNKDQDIRTINHNSYQPQPNYNHNDNKNNYRPKNSPPVQQSKKFNTNNNINKNNEGSGPTPVHGLNSFSPNLGTTINAPGIGNIRIILLPQNRLGQIQNTINGIHIPISIPVTQIPQNYQIESNQQQDQTYKHNQDNSGHRQYQVSPQQDEDYPANERYRESNYNQQGVDNQREFNPQGVNKQPINNQQGNNKHQDYNQQGVNKHQDYNQHGANKHQDYNQQGANNHQDYNQQGANNHQDYNQHGANNHQDYNQQGANNHQDYNQQGVNKHQDYNQQGVNKHQDYNQQGVNKHQDYNQQGVNNNIEFNQQGAHNNQDYNQQGAHNNQDYNQQGVNNQNEFNPQSVNKHHNYNQQGANKHHNYNQQGANNQQKDFDQRDANKQYDYSQQDTNKQYDYNQQGVNKHQDYNQYEQMRPGNQYGQDYNEQYDQSQPNYNQQNEQKFENPKDTFYFNPDQSNRNSPSQPEQPLNYNHPNNQRPVVPKKPNFHQAQQPTYRDTQNQYKEAGAPIQFIPKPHNPRYNHYETHNAPYDNSFQPQQPTSREENRDEPKRKPSKEMTQFSLQLPPDYVGDSQQDLNLPMNELKPKSPEKQSQTYREHRERVTTELYKNDEIPPMPPFPDFMPHFPYRSYEPRRIRKSPPSTTTTTTKPTTNSLVTPSMNPIKVQVANPSDPSKGPITLLLYIDSKGLGSFNQSSNTKK